MNTDKNEAAAAIILIASISLTLDSENGNPAWLNHRRVFRSSYYQSTHLSTEHRN